MNKCYFPNYPYNDRNGIKGNIKAEGKWVDFGEEGSYYMKTNMVRYGNSGNWSKPKFVSGQWKADNKFFGCDPHPGYRKKV